MLDGLRCHTLKPKSICSDPSLHSQWPKEYVNTIEELGVTMDRIVDMP